MKNDDVELIQRILSGDERAFTALVEKHQKWVHALAWREIGDYHIAQEITQDTFIKVFKVLPTLENHNKFSGWLYVIAKRQCIAWLRKKPEAMQSLDAMPTAELEQRFYVQYLEEEQERAAAERLRAVFKVLLQKLPAAERAVVVLHYFRGLSCEDISARLDVSPNTVKSRLYRARKRLEQEKSMVIETLGPNLLKSEPRCIGVQATAAIENGELTAEGGFNLNRTDTVLASTGSHTTGIVYEPVPMYMLLHYINHGSQMNIFKFPLVVGSNWVQEGAWNSQAETTLCGYEAVEVSAGTFSECLKHKTVFTDADVEGTNAEQRNTFVNGTRYLWFAKGVGLVQMRYEHANGVTTEAELLEYTLPIQGKEYLPEQVGTRWTYKWQNDYRDEAVIEAWHVIRNFSQLENLDNLMELESARYEVKIDADEPRVAHVKCVLTPKIIPDKKESRKPLLLSMSHFGTEWLYDGYARYLRDLTVTDAKGKTLPVEEIDKTHWVVEARNASPVTLRYKVLLNHDEREWPAGRDEAPYAQGDCLFWTGAALFVVGEVSDIELRLDVPDNWHVSTPWERIGHSGHRFVCKDQDDLMYAYLVLGEHCERLAHLSKGPGNMEIVLAAGGRFKPAIGEVQGTVESILHAYSEVFGGTPKGRMLFVANPYGREGHHAGGVSGRSISVLVGGTLDKANRHFWGPLVAHVVCYIWNGEVIRFRQQEYWFGAGFTEYYSRIICTRLGLTSESDFLRNLERTWESYLSRQGGLSVREAGENKSAHRELVYDGGSLIAAALDLQIRKRTQNRSSLDDVMKQMYREFGLTDTAYTMDDVIRIVSQIAGKDFEAFFTKYVTGTERLPLAEYLADAGVDVNIEFGERLPSLEYIVHEMLQINSLGGPTGEGMFIRRSQRYQHDDNLIGINGTPVKTFDDIRRVARDWKSGDVVELTLERDGEPLTVPVTLGGTSEKPPLAAGIIDVTVTKRTDSTDLQRAIWSGMLGKGDSYC